MTGPTWSAHCERIYQMSLRVIVLREAEEDACAELELALGSYPPEFAGMVGLILIARACGRYDQFSQRPVVSVAPRPQQPSDAVTSLSQVVKPVAQPRRRGRPPKKVIGS